MSTGRRTEILDAGMRIGNAVRKRFEIMRRHRDISGVSLRMLHCQRAFNGEYSPQQLAEIKKFGGSDAFARVTSVKCRTFAALLEDLYLGPDRPWALEPTPEPALPEPVQAAMAKLMQAEIEMATQAAMQTGAPPPSPEQITARIGEVYDLAMKAAVARARKEAKRAEKRLDDVLVDGGFKFALRDFIANFSRYPVAILKGPFFDVSRKMKYVNGEPVVQQEAVPAFSAPSPFDVWFGPGVHKASDGDIVERIRKDAASIRRLAAAPGYDGRAIEAALDEFPDGYAERTSNTDEARAQEENRESPRQNDEGLYDIIEFHGRIALDDAKEDPLLSKSLRRLPHRALLDEDDGESVCVVVRMIGKFVIGAHVNPDPLERPIYHVASFEATPGSVYGRGLPEVLDTPQGLANAALRSLINNMALASGPQVGYASDRMTDDMDVTEMYPWKRWPFLTDPSAPTAQPLVFFQPNSNANELLMVYDRAMQYADEVSAIPRYASGGERVGGAGKTASGLAMLMGNVAKVVKHTAGSIDDGVFHSVLTHLYDPLRHTDDSGVFKGDEIIRVLGAQNAEKREVEKTRLLEGLQITANPIDMQIMGMPGRAKLLAGVFDNLGLGHMGVDPDIEAIEQMEAAQKAQPAQPGADPAAQAQGAQAPAPGPEGPPRVNAGMDNAQRTRTPAAIAAQPGGQ